MKPNMLLKLAVAASLVSAFAVACAPKDKKLSGTKPGDDAGSALNSDQAKANMKLSFGDAYNAESDVNKAFAERVQAADLKLEDSATDTNHAIIFGAYFNDMIEPLYARVSLTKRDATSEDMPNAVAMAVDDYDCALSNQSLKKDIGSVFHLEAACIDKDCNQISILVGRAKRENSGEEQVAFIFQRSGDTKDYNLSWAAGSSGYAHNKLKGMDTITDERKKQVDEGNFNIKTDVACEAVITEQDRTDAAAPGAADSDADRERAASAGGTEEAAAEAAARAQAEEEERTRLAEEERIKAEEAAAAADAAATGEQ